LIAGKRILTSHSKLTCPFGIRYEDLKITGSQGGTMARLLLKRPQLTEIHKILNTPDCPPNQMIQK